MSIPDDIDLTANSSTHFQLAGTGLTIDFFGHGLVFDASQGFTAGTITGYALHDSARGGLQFEISGFAISAQQFLNAAISGNTNLLAQLLYGGNDTMLGSSGADSLFGGNGSDFLTGRGGNDTLDGGLTGTDTLQGGLGDDVFVLRTGATAIWEAAGEGTDEVRAQFGYWLPDHVERLLLEGFAGLVGGGNALDNLIVGTSGNDTLDGAGGSDTLAGGHGDDLYKVDSHGDALQDAGGTDTVETAVDNFVLLPDLEHLVLSGTVTSGTGNQGANRLVGNSAANALFGLGGNDTLEAGNGADTLDGGDGDDSMAGGDGIDTLNGGNGADTLDGGGGIDVLQGGAGHDHYILSHAGEAPVEAAGGGTDTVLAGWSMTLGAHLENLHLTGAAGLAGTGNALANQILGTAGADTLDGGAGADTMSGGEGGDSYHVDQAADVIEDAEFNLGAADTVYSSTSFDLREAPGIENLILTGTAALNAIGNDKRNLLRGNDGDNTLTADYYSQDTLEGGGGNDSLIGGVNADTLDGGTGADTMVGGEHNDIYTVDDAGDLVVEAWNQYDHWSDDHVFSSVSYTLPMYVERLTLTGNAPLNGTGSLTHAIITGNDAVNVLHTGGGYGDELHGNGGDDLLHDDGASSNLYGGTGDDTYWISGVNTHVFEEANGGFDAVFVEHDYYLGEHIEQLTLVKGYTAVGNAQDNLVIGNANSNSLDGEAGADTMRGGAGSDAYYVDNTGDVVEEYADEGIADEVDLRANLDFSLAGTHVERLSLGYGETWANRGIGNALDNTITGTDGDNWIDGGAGVDSLHGFAGDDTYVVDNANDFVGGESPDTGQDTVRSTAPEYLLPAYVEQLVLLPGALHGTGNEQANRISGNAAGNSLTGADGNDTLRGFEGNDSLSGGSGSDLLDGDAGDDRAIYEGNRADYVLQATAGGFTLARHDAQTNSTATDTLVGIDRIVFADQVLVLNPHLATGAISVSGTPRQQSVLSAIASGVADAEGTGTLAWQWFRNEVSIDGATASTYTPVAADVGATLRARARFIDGAGNTESLWSAPTAAIAPPPDFTPPTATITDDQPGTAGGTIKYTISFSEAVTGLAVGDFSVTGGATLGTLTGAGATWTLSVTPPQDMHGSLGLTLAAGAASDGAGNLSGLVSSTAQPVDTRLPAVNGNSAADAMTGTGRIDRLSALGGDDTLAGHGGNDVLDGGSGLDGAVYTGARAQYTVTAADNSALTVTDSQAGRDGSDTLANVEFLEFSDRRADLTLQTLAEQMDPATLKMMLELYVGFFNRIPEADGIRYWIEQMLGTGGQVPLTIEQVSDLFYEAGKAFEVYDPDLSDQDFIRQVYDYVLYRPAGSEHAPTEQEVNYWYKYLNDATWPYEGSPIRTHGTMVMTMLNAAHGEFYSTDPVFGFVGRAMDNKEQVAYFYAIELGLSFRTPDENIDFGKELAAAVTPDGTDEAVALIGIPAG